MGPVRSWTWLCLALLLTGATASLEVTAPNSPLTVLSGTNVTFVFAITPWPPIGTETITLSFCNPANVSLCRPQWISGQFDNSTATCSLNESRVSDFKPFMNAGDGVWFQLAYVKLSDMGDYTLQVTVDSQSASAPLHLVVHGPPPVPGIHSNKPCDDKTTCVEEDTVKLSCSVRDSNPPADLVWTRKTLSSPETIIYPENYQKAGSWQDVTSSVISRTLQRQDHAAIYRCTAENGIAPSSDAAYVTNVKYAPSVELSPCTPGTNYSIVENMGDARFICKVASNPVSGQVEWKLPSGVSEKPNHNNTQLSLLGPDRQYSGLYHCSATNDIGQGSADCILDIIYGPTINLPTHQSALKGDKLLVTCHYTSNPAPHEMYWTKQNNGTFRMSGDTLTIPHVHWQDAGNFTCHVTNSLWPTGGKKTEYPAVKTTEVIIEYGPEWVDYAVTKFAGREGSSASIECRFRAMPSPIYSWSRLGAQLIPGSGVNIVTTAQGSTVHLDSVLSSQLGFYICRATNEHMSLEKELMLLEPGAPDAPQVCHVVGEPSGKQAELDCVLGYQGGATVILDVVAIKVSSSPDLQATQNALDDFTESLPRATVFATGLQPETSYQLKIYASNEHGRSSTAHEITIMTGAPGPAPRSKAPVDIGPLVAGIVGAIILAVLLLGLIAAIKVWGIPPIPQKYKDMRARNKEEAFMRREIVRQMNLQKEKMEEMENTENEENEASTMGKENLAFDYGPDRTSKSELLPRQVADVYGGRQSHNKPVSPPLTNHRTTDNHQSIPWQHEAIVHSSRCNTPDVTYRTPHQDYSSLYRQPAQSPPLMENNNAHQMVPLLDPSRGRSAQAPSGFGIGAMPLDPSRGQSTRVPNGFGMDSRPVIDSRHSHNNRVPSGFGMGSIDTPHGRQSSLHEDITDWEMSRNELHFVRLLGEGQFTEVWRSLITGRDGRRVAVAVKKPRVRCPPEEVEALLGELDARQHLTTHNNILQLFGCCTREDPVYLVTEFASNGSLLQYLRACRSQQISESGSWMLTSRDLVVFGLQVATGMDYLVQHGFLHRDLAARSVLLDHKLTCKLADFADADYVAQARHDDTQRLVPVRWLAPECLFDNLYSVRSDVWAFGVLLWELITVGATPYPGLRPDVVLDFLAAGRRMERPVQCPPAIYRVMLSCWHGDPGQRPSFGLLCQRLEALLDTLDREPGRIVPVGQLVDFGLPIIDRPSAERC